MKTIKHLVLGVGALLVGVAVLWLVGSAILALVHTLWGLSAAEVAAIFDARSVPSIVVPVCVSLAVAFGTGIACITVASVLAILVNVGETVEALARRLRNRPNTAPGTYS